MRRSLPVLNDGPDALDLVEIPIPCEVSWDSMPGDEQVRHCGDCRQNVYNVSSFTRAEAMKLLRARACLRIYRRPDNTVITSDCRERLRTARKRGLLIFAGALLVVLWAQICAQFVGLMGLKRLIGGGERLGTPVPISVPVMGAPPPLPPPPPVMGEPPPLPKMGEVAAPPQKKLMGKIIVPKGEHTLGRVRHVPASE
jgi:hypothetical protein